MFRNKVVIIAPFINFPSESGFNRFIYIANKLSLDNDVTLLTSNFSHVLKKRRNLNNFSNEFSFKIEFVSELGYVSNFSLRRFLSIIICEINIIVWLIRNSKQVKDSIVYCGFPLVMYNIVLNKYFSNLYKALFIDVQDIWPHSISSVFKKNILLNKILNYLKILIFKSFKNTECFFVVSKTYSEYFSDFHRSIPRHVIYIGGDFKFIEGVPAKSYNSSINIKFFYIGTLSYSYDIETAINVFNSFYSLGKNYELHIFGSGPQERKFKSMASSNIYFHGNMPYEHMIAYCKSFDCALNLIAEGAPQSVTNKISDYLLLNKMIISSKGCEEVDELVRLSNGELYLPGSSESLMHVIDYSIKNSMYNGRSLNIEILKKFDRTTSYLTIINTINNLNC